MRFKFTFGAVVFFSIFICFTKLSLAQESLTQNTEFSFETVSAIARQLSTKPYQQEASKISEKIFSSSFNYDKWRDIRFKPSKALWRDENLPFEVQFFHLGLYYDKPVKINVVDNSDVRTIPYNSADFDYGQNKNLAANLPKDLGFAGFRLHYAIKNPEYKDEVAVFLGASYFRAVGKSNTYGLSARGLAIDTASNRTEEFPIFKEFWLVKPKPEDKSMTIYALLDSPSTVGAYEFTIIPGDDTITEVKSELIQRHRVTTLGIAPLTSMFFYGENFNTHRDDDFRPEIHDSDGLSFASGTGEWLWRPLTGPEDRVLTNTFFAEHLVGFGLMQRDQNFDHYQDLEAHYQSRPSAFITPKGDWGPGEVRLVQIPSPSEVYDNVVAFWSPQNVPNPGTPMRFDYSLSWGPAKKDQPNIGQVVATRKAVGNFENSVKFVIDFESERLKSLSANARLAPNISISEGAELIETQLIKNEITGGWRLVFQIKTQELSLVDGILSGPKKPLIEMRAFLSQDGEVLTETWSYGLDL